MSHGFFWTLCLTASLLSSGLASAKSIPDSSCETKIDAIATTETNIDAQFAAGEINEKQRALLLDMQMNARASLTPICGALAGGAVAFAKKQTEAEANETWVKDEYAKVDGARSNLSEQLADGVLSEPKYDIETGMLDLSEKNIQLADAALTGNGVERGIPLSSRQRRASKSERTVSRDQKTN